VHQALKDLIREKRGSMTIDIEYQGRDGAWCPLGGHGCYTDQEALDYVSQFTTNEYPLRTRPIHDVHPWMTESPSESDGPEK
jgi:hypothetical protein